MFAAMIVAACVLTLARDSHAKQMRDKPAARTGRQGNLLRSCQALAAGYRRTASADFQWLCELNSTLTPFP
jgi:hypothetical protein